LPVPLSVIVQVTKRCDFDCTFCSVTMQMKDSSLEQLAVMSGNLAGVRRVFLVGGEPLLRRDLLDVAGLFGASSSACRRTRPAAWLSRRGWREGSVGRYRVRRAA
jgi:molybdenum cofactor biosynthesis enzyme MoaA